MNSTTCMITSVQTKCSQKRMCYYIEMETKLISQEVVLEGMCYFKKMGRFWKLLESIYIVWYPQVQSRICETSYRKQFQCKATNLFSYYQATKNNSQVRALLEYDVFITAPCMVMADSLLQQKTLVVSMSRMLLPCQNVTNHKNIERHTAHTIVPLPNPKQWVIVHTTDLMLMIRQSIEVQVME